jgi:hypothetical protein
VIDDQIARAETLVSRAGAGPALAHCAESIECSLIGFPMVRSWLFRATIGAIVKRKFLRAGAMRHDTGAGLPGQPRISGDVAAGEALARLRKAVVAFRGHPGEYAPHPVYGDCTRNEYERLHAMHLADHLAALG